MRSLFLKVKTSSVLLFLKDSQQSWYPSKLARACNSSYVHTVNLLNKLSALGVVTSERKGRQNFYKLTEKGAYLASPLDDFAKKCDALEQEAKAASEKSSQAAAEKEKPAVASEKKQ